MRPPTCLKRPILRRRSNTSRKLDLCSHSPAWYYRPTLQTIELIGPRHDTSHSRTPRRLANGTGFRNLPTKTGWLRCPKRIVGRRPIPTLWASITFFNAPTGNDSRCFSRSKRMSASRSVTMWRRATAEYRTQCRRPDRPHQPPASAYRFPPRSLPLPGKSQE